MKHEAIPPFLDVRLTRSPERLAEMAATIARWRLSSSGARNTGAKPMTTTIGPKEQALRDLWASGKKAGKNPATAAPPTKQKQPNDSDGPRVGTVDLSTIKETGTLNAKTNLDAQAKKDAAKAAPKETKAKTTAKAPASAEPMEETVKTSTARKPAAKAKPAARTSDRRKPKAKAKASAARPTKAAKEVKVKQPRGMGIEILKLASRAKGVSPSELRELTKWKGVPWKWTFSNPKKTGYCDRFGYTFEVLDVDGETRYKVTKKG